MSLKIEKKKYFIPGMVVSCAMGWLAVLAMDFQGPKEIPTQ